MKHFIQKTSCILVILLLLLGGCGKKAAVNDTWIDEAYYDRVFENVFVVGAAEKLTVRNMFEAELVNRLNRMGIIAIPSNEVILYTNNLTREALSSAVTKNGVDSLLIISLVGKGSSAIIYDTLKSTNPYAYYSGLNNPNKASVYVDVSEGTGDLFLKATLYDAATEKLVWSLTSEKAFNYKPKSLINAARLIINKLREDGLI
jgi:hypothetical protein